MLSFGLARACLILLDILAEEMKKLYSSLLILNQALNRREIDGEQSRQCLINYQMRRNGKDEGRWTCKLIPYLKRYMV